MAEAAFRGMGLRQVVCNRGSIVLSVVSETRELTGNPEFCLHQTLAHFRDRPSVACPHTVRLWLTLSSSRAPMLILISKIRSRWTSQELTTRAIILLGTMCLSATARAATRNGHRPIILGKLGAVAKGPRYSVDSVVLHRAHGPATVIRPISARRALTASPVAPTPLTPEAIARLRAGLMHTARIFEARHR